MAQDEIVDVSDAALASRIESLRIWSWVGYAMHLVVALGAVVPGMQASVGLLIVALVLDLILRGNAQGTWLASHFSWRIRSVGLALLGYVLTSPLWLLLLAPGWIAWGIISIWFLYRIVKGMVRMNRQVEMESTQR